MKNLNRWVYAIAGVVILLFAGLVYAWSVLSGPIAAEFTQWTKAQLSLTFTLVMICFCIGCMICGFTLKKISARTFVWASAVLFLVGFFLASRTQSLPMLYISFGIMCGLASGMGYNAVMATIVASNELSEDVIYAFVKGLFDYKADITASHVKGNELDINTAVSGVSIPWHPGAVKYFAEQGITLE